MERIEQLPPFFTVEAATFDQVGYDDLICVDSVLGYERVTGVSVYDVPSPATPKIVVLRLEYRRFVGEDYREPPRRFIVRGWAEPVARLVRVAREAAEDVQRVMEEEAALSLGEGRS